MYETCPKCTYQRGERDTGPAGVCPACGLVFEKWLKNQYRPEDEGRVPASALAGPAGALTAALWERLVYVPERTDTTYFYVRLAVFAGLVVWGIQFMFMDYYKVIGGHRVDLPVAEIGGSFMHIINTPFHEFGHLMFRPFGELMMYLGGTLGQLLMPTVVMLWFLFKEHNTFAASVGLWWLGQSLMDCAPYINDARVMQMPLIGGGPGSEGRVGLHDWHNILLRLDALRSDHAVAALFNRAGAAVMVLAFAWGGIVLYRQYRNR